MGSRSKSGGESGTFESDDGLNSAFCHSFSMNGVNEALEMDPNEGSLIIVLYRLPIIATRNANTHTWTFKWDDDAIYLTSDGIRKALNANRRVIWVGILSTIEEVLESERDNVSQYLAQHFSCVPVFLPRETLIRFYSGFCKRILWPLFHMMSSEPADSTKVSTKERILSQSEDGSTQYPAASANVHQFDRSLWQTYTVVNRKFSDVVVSVYQGESTLIWIHDYHLLLLPMQLRRRLTGAKIGLYLHTPWPSSELYRTLPVRDELLRSVLSVTLLGFNLFDYARHFLSCCVRLLDLEHFMKNGNILIEYAGRRAVIRVSHIGIDPERFSSCIESQTVKKEVHRLLNVVNGYRSDSDRRRKKESVEPVRIVCGIDDIDATKGLPFKLLAFEQLLINLPQYREHLVLYQVAIPRDVPTLQKLREETYDIIERINEEFGTESYTPVIFVEQRLSLVERVALYQASDAMLLTPIRDGLNLIPYEFLIAARPGKGRLVLSENTGCSRALFSAIRVNPWNSQEIMYSLDMALCEDEQQAAEEQAADVHNLKSNTIAKWARSFVSDLESIEEPKMRHRVALGLGSQGMGELADLNYLDPMNIAQKVQGLLANEANELLFVFGYEGVLLKSRGTSSTSDENFGSFFSKAGRSKALESAGSSALHHHVHSSWATRISERTLNSLNVLSKQKHCHVFILSSHTIDQLEKVFDESRQIGLLAENGFYMRAPGSDTWQGVTPSETDLSWIDVAREIINGYCERTDGSYLEETHAGLVWHFQDADPTFGSWQAKELHDHLESVLGVFDVEVVQGEGWLLVRLKDLAKLALEAIWLRALGEDKKRRKRLGFALACCSGRADESFLSVLENRALKSGASDVFPCCVEVPPFLSSQFYMRSSAEVEDLLLLLSQSSSVSTLHVL